MTTDPVSDVAPVVQPADNSLLIESASAPRTVQLWQPWTLIVPALLVLPFICLAFSWQMSPSTDEVLLNKRHRRVGAQPTTAPHAMPLQLVVFVPGDDEKLHSRIIHHSSALQAGEIVTDDAVLRKDGIAVLENLIAASPDYFPPGTKVEDLELERNESGLDIAKVSLNATFWNSDYWAMDSRSHLTIQAIAQTLAEFYRQRNMVDHFTILLLRDGQNPDRLGPELIADPIPLDDSILGAPSPSAVAAPATSSVTWPKPGPKAPPATVAAP